MKITKVGLTIWSTLVVGFVSPAVARSQSFSGYLVTDSLRRVEGTAYACAGSNGLGLSLYISEPRQQVLMLTIPQLYPNDGAYPIGSSMREGPTVQYVPGTKDALEYWMSDSGSVELQISGRTVSGKLGVKLKGSKPNARVVQAIVNFTAAHLGDWPPEVGCTAANKRKHVASKDWPPRIATAVLEGTLVIGMTDAMVREAWGPPEKIDRTVTAAGRDEIWHYGRSVALVTNGKLRAWRTVE